MAKLLKLRRGTTAQHSSFTGAEGEVTIDTTKDTAVVHDGSQAGGRPLAREDMSNVSSASIAGRLGNDSIATDKIAAGNLPSDVKIVTSNITNGTIVNEDISSNAAIAGTKLENSGVTAGQYGSSSAIPIVTVDAQGLVTAASTTAIDSTTIANGSSSVSVANNGAITSNANHDFSAGIDVTGNITTTGNIELNDNRFVYVGDSNDGRLYHDQSNTYLEDNGTGELRLASNNGAGVRITKGSSETLANFTNDGACEFFHDNSQKMNTNASGINVSGNIAVSGTVDGVDVAALNTTVGNLGISGGAIASGTTAVTQGQSANNTQIATTAYVRTAINNAQAFPSGTKMIFQQSSAPTGWTKITSSVNNKALRLVSGNVSSGGNQAFTSAFASRTPAGNVGTSGNSAPSFSANATTGNSTASFSGSVSGNTGNSGASTSSVSTSGSVNNHTLSNNQVPSHSHSFNIGNPDSYGDGYRLSRRNSNNAGNFGTNSSGGGGSHSHGFSGSSHSHNVNNHTHSFSGNFSGNTGNHTHSVTVSGNTANHTHSGGSFSGSAMDFAVQYIDVIVCSKD